MGSSYSRWSHTKNLYILNVKWHMNWHMNLYFQRVDVKKLLIIKGLVLVIGGAGGNRTPVRKSSTDRSTYLAMLFMFNFYSANKQANIKASYLMFKKLLSNPVVSESLYMTL